MTDWRAIADQLAASLAAMPCRCQMAGGAKWHVMAQAVVSAKCSRCVALEAYKTGRQEEGAK